MKYVNILLERRNSNVECIKQMYIGLEKMQMRNNSDLFNCIMDTYNQRTVSTLDKFHTVENALINLDCFFWVELLQSCKIRDYMDYQAYTDMCNMFNTRNKEREIPFDFDHVHGFLQTIINNKDTIFASKIEGLLLSLDKGYKSNQGNNLSAVLVLNAPSYANDLGWEKVNILKDLRYSLQQIYNLPLDVTDTQNLVYACKGYDWESIDHDLIRMKSFKNGNVHIHLSDIVYIKFNEILALLNKNILDYDTSKVKRKTYKYNGDLIT